MADVTLTYKGSDILELSDSGSATLKTGGKYCEDDIAVEYVKPSGGGISWQDYFEGIAPTGRIVLEGSPWTGEVFRTKLRDGYTFTLYSTATGNLTASSFRNMQGCTCAVLPFVTTGDVSGHLISECINLQIVDWGALQVMPLNTHYRCLSLQTVILRSNTLCQLANLSGMNNQTPFKSDGTGGTLYVPQALISDYQNATNWSTLLGYPNNQILPIEGSYYETHYADGTEITS